MYRSTYSDIKLCTVCNGSAALPVPRGETNYRLAPPAAPEGLWANLPLLPPSWAGPRWDRPWGKVQTSPGVRPVGLRDRVGSLDTLPANTCVGPSTGQLLQAIVLDCQWHHWRRVLLTVHESERTCQWDSTCHERCRPVSQSKGLRVGKRFHSGCPRHPGTRWLYSIQLSHLYSESMSLASSSYVIKVEEIGQEHAQSRWGAAS